jgi:hypothetical protein
MSSKLQSSPPARHAKDTKLLYPLERTMEFLAINMVISVLLAIGLDYFFPNHSGDPSSNPSVFVSYSQWAVSELNLTSRNVFLLYMYGALQIAIAQNFFLGRGLFVWN